jgi:hypothetical protein
MKSINSFFEKKILFEIGRYFWNLTAVGGFLAVFGGGLIVFNSAVKQQLFEKEVMTELEWNNGGNLKSRKTYYYNYADPLKEFNNIVRQKREASKVLALGGFGLIVASSSMSTFYALERNTRKKED